MSEGCKQRIFGDWKHYDCSRKAVIDGYCKQHHPDSVKKRREESDRKWSEKQANTPLSLALKKVKSLEADNALLTARIKALENAGNDALADMRILFKNQARDPSDGSYLVDGECANELSFLINSGVR